MTSRFARFGRGGVFTCKECGKLTRDVNGSNGCVQMCGRCEAIAMSENFILDGGSVEQAIEYLPPKYRKEGAISLRKFATEVRQ